MLRFFSAKAVTVYDAGKGLVKKVAEAIPTVKQAVSDRITSGNSIPPPISLEQEINRLTKDFLKALADLEYHIGTLLRASVRLRVVAPTPEEQWAHADAAQKWEVLKKYFGSFLDENVPAFKMVSFPYVTIHDRTGGVLQFIKDFEEIHINEEDMAKLKRTYEDSSTEKGKGWMAAAYRWGQTLYHGQAVSPAMTLLSKIDALKNQIKEKVAYYEKRIIQP